MPDRARQSPDDAPARPRVGLLVTCLVDLFRPAVGFAAVRLLEDAGCVVDVPAVQTCCGQPAYNGGDSGNARAIAKRTIEAFEPFDYVVAPSGFGEMAREARNREADAPAHRVGYLSFIPDTLLCMAVGLDYFETRWKPKSWNARYRFIFIRKQVRCQHKLPIQLDPRARGTTAKRAALWCFREIGTLRRTLIQCAGRIIRPAGKLILSMNSNGRRERELRHALATLNAVA